MARKITAAVAALLGAAWGPTALAAWELNMPPGVTEISREIFGLHMLILWICVAIGVVVFGAEAVQMDMDPATAGVQLFASPAADADGDSLA